MRELVRNERVAGKVEVCARVVQGAVGLRRRRRVFHAAENKIGNRDLAVPFVGVRHSDDRLEAVDHARRVAERAFTVGFAAAFDVIPNRQPRVRLANLGEVAGDHRHEIRRMRDALFVAENRCFAVVETVDEFAVGQGEEALGHDDRRRCRLLVGWMIEARKPEARVLVLALRPDLARPVDEIQAAARRDDTIGNGERRAFAGGERSREVDRERLARRFEPQGAAVERHRRHVQVDGIEPDARDPVLDRFDGLRADRVERLGPQIRAQPQIDMHDVDNFIGPIVRQRASECERTMVVQIPAPSLKVSSNAGRSTRAKAIDSNSAIQGATAAPSAARLHVRS